MDVESLIISVLKSRLPEHLFEAKLQI